MAISIRPTNPTTDFAKIAELLTYAELDPTTEADLHEEEARVVPRKLRLRVSAANEAEQVVGYGTAVYYPSEPTGLFHLMVVVEPTYERQGIGTHLYERLLGYTRTHGADVLAVEILEKFPHALAAAEKAGFRVYRHALNATLDLEKGARIPLSFRQGMNRAPLPLNHEIAMIVLGDFTYYLKSASVAV